jgi:hypothetical protein
MLKIKKAANGGVVLTLSSRMDGENVLDLKNLLLSEVTRRRIVLDLKDLTLVDQEAVNFLEQCEWDGIKFKSCPAYIRQWISRRRNGGSS